MFRKRVKMQVVATNLSQLADLLQNGVPLLKSLEILAAQATQKELADILNDIHDRVAEGESLDAAMDRHREVFGELTVSLVRAGSEGAFLEDALKRTADFLELQEELKWRVIGALTYPAVPRRGGVPRGGRHHGLLRAEVRFAVSTGSRKAADCRR